MSNESEAKRAKSAWTQIELRLQSQSPHGLSALNASATDAEIAALEGATGLILPEALRVVLKRHDGETRSSVFGKGFDFLSSQLMAEHWRMHVDVLDYLPPEALSGEFDPEVMGECDPGVRPLVANRKWLPFADNNGDVTRYIDFDPAPGGQVGQVIEVDPEGTIWKVLAPSFGVYLENCLET